MPASIPSASRITPRLTSNEVAQRPFRRKPVARGVLSRRDLILELIKDVENSFAIGHDRYSLLRGPFRIWIGKNNGSSVLRCKVLESCHNQ